MRLFWFLENSGNIIFRQNTGSRHHENIRPALEYMAANYQNDIMIEQLTQLRMNSENAAKRKRCLRESESFFL